MDGALTMQILARVSGTPALFADVRHYHADLGIWELCNSGQHATWFAARSEDPAENTARVNLCPEVFYFPAGGASVQHVAAAGDMTFARLTAGAGHAGGRHACVHGRPHGRGPPCESYGLAVRVNSV
jgi:L-fucose isomerase